jgi:hypothetical protein
MTVGWKKKVVLYDTVPAENKAWTLPERILLLKQRPSSAARAVVARLGWTEAPAIESAGYSVIIRFRP